MSADTAASAARSPEMMVTAGPGVWVAVGHDGEWSDSLVWVSTDGYNWNEVSFGDGSYGELGDVVATPDGLIGVGVVWRNGGYRVSGWGSVDGTTWTLLSTDATGPSSSTWGVAAAVETVGDWLIAFDTQRNKPGDSKPRLWMSPDGGVSWLEVPVANHFGRLDQDDGGQVEDIIVLREPDGREQLVVVGDYRNGGAVWIGTLDN